MLQIFLFPWSHYVMILSLPSPSSRQSPTSSQPTTSASSPSSSWGRTQWSTTAARPFIPVWRESARTTSVGDFSWRTPGPHSWRRGSTAPAPGRSPSTTTSCRAPSTYQSKTSSTASSRLMCEWTQMDIYYSTSIINTCLGRIFFYPWGFCQTMVYHLASCKQMIYISKVLLFYYNRVNIKFQTIIIYIMHVQGFMVCK